MYLPVLCSCLTCVYVYHFMLFQKMAAEVGLAGYIILYKLYTSYIVDYMQMAVGVWCACMH